MSQTDKFCKLPWQHLCIGREGTARTCCVTNQLVHQDGVPMSLYTHSYEQIWNSDYLRDVRRAMLAGERLSQCDVCYHNEAVSGTSYRTSKGRQPILDVNYTIEQLREISEAKNHRVDQHPSFVKLEISNLCNLKCRMCDGAASSEIERDPVHGPWSGGIELLHAVWIGERAKIGPDTRIGVERRGWHKPEFTDDETRYCWSDTEGILSMILDESSEVDSITIEFQPVGSLGQKYEILINGQVVHTSQLNNENMSVAIRLPANDTQRSLEIRIRTADESVTGDSNRALGVPVRSVSLHRKVTEPCKNRRGPELLNQRMARGRPWHDYDDVLFDEVLGDLNALRLLYITGGEPFINLRVFEALDYLIAEGVSSRVDLEFSTNCTRVDESITNRLRKFRSTTLFLSIDAIGSDFEYIRYPARWVSIERNIRNLKAAAETKLCAVPVVQIYNILGLTSLCRFFDEVDIEYDLQNILRFPERLALDVLPMSARRVAAARLRHYAVLPDSEYSRRQLIAIADYLEGLSDPPLERRVREFMLFTNDLDVTRKQSFANSHPELLYFFEKDGFPWTSEKCYATDEFRRMPDGDRIYKWL